MPFVEEDATLAARLFDDDGRRRKHMTRRLRTSLRRLAVSVLPGFVYCVTSFAAATSTTAWLEALQAKDLKTLAELASPEVDVNQHDRVGKTALMLAAVHGDVGLAERLLELGARVDQRNRSGGTALMYAAQYGQVDTARVLLAAGSVVNLQAAKGWTALMIAVLKGREAMVDLLLADGADPNVQDMLGWTPLMRAIEANHVSVARKLLAESDTEVNKTDMNGTTALHVAATFGRANVAELLLALGADSRAQDAKGRTPLMLAEHARHDEVVRLLEGHTAPD